MTNSKRMLVEMTKRRKLAYFGHSVKRNDIQRLPLDGKINRKRGRGKHRLTCAENRLDRKEVQRVYQDSEILSEMEIRIMMMIMKSSQNDWFAVKSSYFIVFQ